MNNAGEAVQSHYREALALHRAGRLAEAADRYSLVLNSLPRHGEALRMLAIVRIQQGLNMEGVALLRRAVEAEPQAATSHGLLGAALSEMGRYEAALEPLQTAAALDPAYVDAHYGIARALAALDRPGEALAAFDAAIARAPDFVEAHQGRGRALQRLGRSLEAQRAYEQVIALRPDFEPAHNNRGLALHRQNRPREAVACFDRAIALRPDYAEAHLNRALSLLMMGELQAGFEAYRWRWQAGDLADRAPRFAFPAWEGQDVSGRSILVHCEQGFGDSLQFVRYAALLARQGARVTVLGPPALARLFRSIPGIAVATDYDGEARDFHVAMMELPRLFGTTLDSIPAEAPYLFADPGQASAWRERLAALASGLKVGLVWAGQSRQDEPAAFLTDQRRSMRLEQLAPLSAAPGVTFVSLQKGEPAAQASRPPQGMRLIDPTAALDDFADTAALVANLDLVITVDTAVAHLAGALGKPVWILSRFDGCWRWLNGREDSPWYLTARLFHQKTPGDWGEVVARVADQLKRMTANDAEGGSLPD